MNMNRPLGPRRRQLLLDTANGIAFQIRAFGGDVAVGGFGIVDRDQEVVHLTATWTTFAGQTKEADLEVGTRTVSIIVLDERDPDGTTPIHEYVREDFSVAMLPGLTVMPYRPPAPAA